MIWEALELFREWERKTVPGVNTRFVLALLVWLHEESSKPKTVGDLYRSSGYSEPTMRACLQEFLRIGLVVVEKDTQDPRRSVVRGTPRLYQSIESLDKRLLKKKDRVTPRQTNPGLARSHPVVSERAQCGGNED